MTSETLPLSLSPFEHWFLVEDRPNYPMTFWVGLELSGKLNSAYFNQALLEAIKIHPRLKAHISGNAEDKTGDIQWVDSGNPMPYVQWDQEGVPLTFSQGVGIDLRKEIGVRVFVREGGKKTKILFQVHHSCSDGLGMIQFLGDFFQIYGKLSENLGAGDNHTFQPLKIPTISLEKDLLLKRIFYNIPRGIYRTLRFLFFPIQDLAVPGPVKTDSKESVAFPSYHSFSFSQEETRDLIRAAASQSATLNDLLLRDLFLSLREWNLKHHAHAKEGYLRVMQPINIRTALDKSGKAKNDFSMVAIDVRPKYFASPRLLLKQVQKITKRIKGLDKFIVLLPKAIGQVGRIKGGLSFMSKEERLFASTLFSFIPVDSLLAFSDTPQIEGKICFGNLKMESLVGFPPLRKTNPAVFGATLYAKKLSVIIHFDPSAYLPSQAKELLEGFIRHLKASKNS
jgi:NRPS condensation-like uncharacterized protein